MTKKKEQEDLGVFSSEEERDMYRAISVIKTPLEAYIFFRDLCTPSELSAMQERWTIARILDAEPELSYPKVRERTGASMATIGRVARYLRKEYFRGYETIINRLKSMPSLKEIDKSLS
tara:strand:- start:31344 stop:31700 length:357 start_codon:yes stop_codon:yes gene_type:complete